MYSSRSAILGLMAVVSACAVTTPSFSEQKCIPRDGFLPLEEGEQFAGLFRIPLKLADRHDPAAARTHLLFANAWAQAISEAIFPATRDLCGAIILPEGFPDLRAFMIVHRTTSQIERERVVCANALYDFLNDFNPDDDQIKRAVEWSTWLEHPKLPGNGAQAVEPREDAAYIAQAALPIIYKEGSILHALASVRVGKPTPIDAPDLRNWIRNQRMLSNLLPEEIPHCLPPHADLASSSDIPQERLESDILPAGEISVSRAGSGPLPPGPLHHIVMVGDPVEPPTLAAHSEVEAKYCGREHTFSIAGESPHPVSITVKPQCESQGVHDLDMWNLIYCDPKDCNSEPVEKAVMAAIASDPEILEFARRSSNTAIPRGPYFISIK